MPAHEADDDEHEIHRKQSHVEIQFSRILRATMYVVTTDETVTNASKYGNAAAVFRLMSQPTTTASARLPPTANACALSGHTPIGNSASP
jgi:hypothetical protein